MKLGATLGLALVLAATACDGDNAAVNYDEATIWGSWGITVENDCGTFRRFFLLLPPGSSDIEGAYAIWESGTAGELEVVDEHTARFDAEDEDGTWSVEAHDSGVQDGGRSVWTRVSYELGSCAVDDMLVEVDTVDRENL